MLLRGCLAARLDLFEDGFHVRQDAFGDDPDPFGCWMQSVAEVQLGIQGNARQEKRIERNAVLFRQIRKDAVEGVGVGVPEAAWRPHPGEENKDTPVLEPAHDRIEIAAGLIDRQSAQGVVGAEFENDDVGPIPDGPIDACQASRRRIAGNACVADLDIVSLGLEQAFELFREAFALFQSVPGGKTIAQRDDANGRCAVGSYHACDKPHADQVDEEDAAHHLAESWKHVVSFIRSLRPNTSVDRAEIKPPKCDMSSLGTWRERGREISGLSKTLIELENVGLTLRSRAGEVAILRDVSLSVRSGESVAIVGPSGSGKTSLLMIIAGLERASTGRVFVDGRDFVALSEDNLARARGATIGIVFQSFHLVPTMTAIENVALPLEFQGRKDAFEAAGRLLGTVGLAPRAQHFPAELSGGEQQRVALGRALALDPRLLLADEPTGNLDGATGRQIIDLLFDLGAERQRTLVLVTHDEALARRCSRIVRMADGRIVADAQTEPQGAVA
jgi:putative ABC transport system ATP-binding protein